MFVPFPATKWGRLTHSLTHFPVCFERDQTLPPTLFSGQDLLWAHRFRRPLYGLWWGKISGFFFISWVLLATPQELDWDGEENVTSGQILIRPYLSLGDLLGLTHIPTLWLSHSNSWPQFWKQHKLEQRFIHKGAEPGSTPLVSWKQLRDPQSRQN